MLCFGDGLAGYGKVFQRQEADQEERAGGPREQKSLAGSILCFLGAFAGMLLFGYGPRAALLGAGLGALGERITLVNDNAVVISCGALGSVLDDLL